jgi:hypothetical protein
MSPNLKYGQSEQNTDRYEFVVFMTIIISVILLLFLAESHHVNISDYLSLFIGYALIGIVLLPVIALIFTLFPVLIYPIVFVFYPFIWLWQRLTKS